MQASLTLVAERDIQVKGSNVVATHDTTLIASRNLSIKAATETHSDTHEKSTKQGGLFGSGGAGFTIGKKQQSTGQQTDATLAARSTIGSTDGNVLLLAGETYKQVGSDVIAVKGDIDIAAKRVDIVEARETSRTTIEQKSKQSGLTIAVTSPVISAIQTVSQMSEAASNTKDPRMQLLAAANIGMTGYNTAEAIKAGQGVTTPDGKTNQVLSGKTNPDGSAEYRDANAADQVGGINVSLSLGSSKSSSKTTQTSNTAAASNLTAGRDIRIEASGAGEQSDLTIQGGKVSAARDLTLTADDEIRLLAAKNTFEQHSSNKSSSASLGVGFALGGTQNGFTIQAGVSSGRGKANGADLTWSNTQLEAGKTLTLDSGGDTTLRGAVVKGEQIIAKVDGDLRIESLQDTGTYDSRQKSLGGSVSLCIPPLCVGGTPVSGSVSASGSKVKSDYANGSVQPVAPLEETVLGGMVTSRIATALGRAWTSLDVYLAGRVSTSAGGSISTQQITREGMTASLNAVERAELSALNTLPESGAQGVLREKVTNDYFARNGFTQLESKCGSNNCFDGVFVKGDTVYVVETKPLQVNGSIKLNGPEGELPTQMTPDWIRYSTERLVESSDPVKQQTAELILQASRQGKLVKIVAGVNENSITLVKLAK